MATETTDIPLKQLAGMAIRVFLQHHRITKNEAAALRCIFPNIVDPFIRTAIFRAPPVPALHRAAAKGLWPQLKVVVLDPVDLQDDNSTIFEAFAALSLPNLIELTVHRIGRSEDPARELTALAGGQWPNLRQLTLHLVQLPPPWAAECEPGEPWDVAIAALAAAHWPVEMFTLRGKPWKKLIEYPLPDIARCFSSTLTTLNLNYSIGNQAIAALALSPISGPKLTRLELWGRVPGRGNLYLDILGENATPWPSVTSFSGEDCSMKSDGANLGTVLPAVQDLWISFLFHQSGTPWTSGRSLLKGFEGSSVLQKVVLKWAPVGVLLGAAGVHLPALRVLSLRYTIWSMDVDKSDVTEGMNALLRADLPVLESLSVSFSDKLGYTPTWWQVHEEDEVPKNLWPSLKTLSLGGLNVGHGVVLFVTRRLRNRVPKVKISHERGYIV